MDDTDGQSVRSVLLSVIQELADNRDSIQSRTVLRETTQKLGIQGDTQREQALLTVWYDLFRQGHMAWGHDIANPEPPFCHLTGQGRKALEHLSRDPANPDGYHAHLKQQTELNPVAQSYIGEALNCFNSGCAKAAAVMVGAAAESLTIELRDALVARMSARGKPVPKKLQDWRIKSILDSLQAELGGQKKSMPHQLGEAFDAYWSAFTQQVRTVRNDAGHPSSVDPVTHEAVHSALLIFPELATLASQLRDWIETGYT